MGAVAVVKPALDVVRIGYRHGERAVTLTQLPAGALTAIARPRSEKPTLVPAWRNPATAMTPGQLAGIPAACPSVLPAAATITAPAAVIWATASWYADVHGASPPKLMLSTRATFTPVGTPGTGKPAAQRIPARMSESKPPHLPSTRTGSTRTFAPTPAT